MANKPLTNEEIKELGTKLIARCWKDPEFKKLLFSNPKAALKELHISFEEAKELRVVEEGQNYVKDERIVTIVLPKAPQDAHKMSEKELEVMAGGSFWNDAGEAFGGFVKGGLDGYKNS